MAYINYATVILVLQAETTKNKKILFTILISTKIMSAKISYPSTNKKYC